MQPITEKQELEIDDSPKQNAYKKTRFYINDEVFVEGKQILAYGEINLNNNEDVELLQSLPIIDEEVFDCRNTIPTTFNYKDGTIDGMTPYSEIWDKILWFKYHHCIIGKPKRIIIYRLDMKSYKKLL